MDNLDKKKDTGYFNGYGNGYIPKEGEMFYGFDSVSNENITVETMTPTPGGHSLDELYRAAQENSSPDATVSIENGAVIIRRPEGRKR